MWIDDHGAEVLPVPECLRLVAAEAARGGVGRLASPGRRSPEVTPVNFAYLDHRVLVRLGEGTAWQKALDQLVTFEVDHLDPRSGRAWSVVVRGLAVDAGPLTSDLDRLPRTVVPQPGSKLLAVRPDVVTGRRFTVSPERPPEVAG